MCYPVLYSLFTYDCKAESDNTLVVKFADDTTVTGFVSNNDEVMYRAQVDSILNWCDLNNLILNVTKTKEMIIDFRRIKNKKEPLTIRGQTVEVVDSFKFLGSKISNDLKWHENSAQLISKARQRLFFLRTLNSFKVNQMILTKFYRAIIESVLTSSIIVWFGRVSQKDLQKMNSVIKCAERIIGISLPSLQTIYSERCQKRTIAIMNDKSHIRPIVFLHFYLQENV